MNIREVSEHVAVPTLTQRQVAIMKYRLAHRERLNVERRERYLAHQEEEQAYQRNH